MEFDSPSPVPMCDICRVSECQHELKHLAGRMLKDKLSDEYPNLRLWFHHDSIHIERGGLAVLRIIFCADRMRVWRCIPRYESEAVTVLAADPDFLDKIVNILIGKAPAFLPAGFNR